jgi:hypothetical protein
MASGVVKAGTERVCVECGESFPLLAFKGETDMCVYCEEVKAGRLFGTRPQQEELRQEEVREISDAPDEAGARVCKLCGAAKPLDEFPTTRGGGKMQTCRSCFRAAISKAAKARSAPESDAEPEADLAHPEEPERTFAGLSPLTIVAKDGAAVEEGVEPVARVLPGSEPAHAAEPRPEVNGVKDEIIQGLGKKLAEAEGQIARLELMQEAAEIRAELAEIRLERHQLYLRQMELQDRHEAIIKQVASL